jgi:hypothetical protein
MLSLHPSDGRFGQLMLPKVRGHRMVPDRAEAVITSAISRQLLDGNA